MDSQEIYAAVSSRYSSVTSDASKLTNGYGKSVAQSFGYTEEELAAIPSDANLGLSCGNPLAVASLREGETVIDLGSGAGFDVFLSAKKVGPTGRVIGIDMNKDMIALAEKNKAKSGATNVEFVEARISSIPLPDGIADVIISNCVVNLVPGDEKQLVFNEIFRLLKPGGRVAISDILAKKPLPEKVAKSAAAYVGCIAGASLVSEYQEYLKNAGFTDVLIKDANADLNVYVETTEDGTRRAKNGEQKKSGCCAPTATVAQACCTAAVTAGDACCSPEKKASGCCAPKAENPGCCAPVEMAGDRLDLKSMAAELADVDLNELVGSYKIFAVKSLNA